MSFFSWLNGKLSSITSHRTHRPARRPPPFRPWLEALEDRDLPSFTAPITTFTSGGLAAAGDINRDGKADLVVATRQYVSVYIGQGNGQFTPPALSYAAVGDTHITAVALADVNNDGRLDLLTGNAPGDGALFGERDSITVRLGNGKGGFGPPQTYQVFSTTEGPTSLAVADFNGDGKLDIAASNGSEGTLEVTLNAGNGAFLQAAQTFSIPIGTAAAPTTVVAGDFNGDGRLDLVVASETGGYILLNTGSGFTAPLLYDAVGEDTLAVADVNGDGKLDVVTSSNSLSVSVLLGHGDGTFATAQTNVVGGVSSIALGDFNKDGKVDIVTTGAAMNVLLNNGDGTFGAPQTVGPAGGQVVVADFNKDGFLDLAQLDANGIDAFLNNADWPGTTGQKGHK